MYSDRDLVSFTGAAEELGFPVQLRIPHTREAHKVGRFFDLGVSGALVPEVMESATVQDALDFAYYGPFGRRSWGGANRLGLRTRTAPTARREYAAWWNETILLSIQIESVQTVTNIARLVRPGITHVTGARTTSSSHSTSIPSSPSGQSRRAWRTWHRSSKVAEFGSRWGPPPRRPNGRSIAISG